MRGEHRMTFLVTYRDRTGAKREEALEAVSRDPICQIEKTL